MTETKSCKRCSKIKNMSAFAIKDGARGNRNSRCCACESEIKKEYYIKKKEKANARAC